MRFRGDASFPPTLHEDPRTQRRRYRQRSFERSTHGKLAKSMRAEVNPTGQARASHAAVPVRDGLFPPAACVLTHTAP